ncbi:hypothetical protein HNR42_002990 [Deinobacterium chartae]|uniref:Aminoglycoside phosphotransferase domain-containing protein n=1 Tax=Deinobacterium chartae TaxID=521158 RepID=A0A841I533_9DEIO|nr:aminoglycoside phosphotransferase family protein [Deinobacterium chartae]MBB6099540.1 hypothetical protein [Deinobacterium chartae]
MSSSDEAEPRELPLSPEKGVTRRGEVVSRPAAAWTPAVHRLLEHLQAQGFTAAPRVLHSPAAGEPEQLVFVHGEFVHPRPWSDAGLTAMGALLRQLHEAAIAFEPPSGAVWQPWFLRELGGPNRIISHGDIAPWNVVTRAGLPVALIDWEFAGPIDPLTELARVCWLFAQLHGPDVTALHGLPPAEVRAAQVRRIAEAYGASPEQRHALVERMIEVAVYETAFEADERQVGPDSAGPQWGFAWRARAAAWMLGHRDLLQRALL